VSVPLSLFPKPAVTFLAAHNQKPILYCLTTLTLARDCDVKVTVTLYIFHRIFLSAPIAMATMRTGLLTSSYVNSQLQIVLVQLLSKRVQTADLICKQS